MRGGELLGALDEGRRLVLVVGALGLGEQLADPVDEPIPVTALAPTSTRSRRTRPAARTPPPRRAPRRPAAAGHGGERRRVARRRARSARPRGGRARAAATVSRSAHGSPCRRHRQRDDPGRLPVGGALAPPQPQPGRARRPEAPRRPGRGRARAAAYAHGRLSVAEAPLGGQQHGAAADRRERRAAAGGVQPGGPRVLGPVDPGPLRRRARSGTAAAAAEAGAGAGAGAGTPSTLGEPAQDGRQPRAPVDRARGCGRAVSPVGGSCRVS